MQGVSTHSRGLLLRCKTCLRNRPQSLIASTDRDGDSMRSQAQCSGISPKFARRFAERIGKLAKNTSGNHRKKIGRLTTRMLEAAELAGCRSILMLLELVPHTAYFIPWSSTPTSTSKSLAFDYLDEKPIDTGLMKFLGSVFPPCLGTWSLSFHSPPPRLLL
ncbi:hypothetical protein BHM03_00008349 [Ensete ventricosum]|nr:hypothetical protein BHM03_00008349 [Ensete ventricosum]